jgi:cysteine synthase A
MMVLRADALECIGNTPLLALRRLSRRGAKVLLKIEAANPTGSMKDRMALAMIEGAERDGRLRPGGSVVEYTTGSTGTSLALVCGVKGYPLDIVTADAFAEEKLSHMTILGARVRVLKSDGGRMTEQLTLDMIAAAKQIAADTGAVSMDQLRNTNQLNAYRALADEVWTQTGGRVDAFVQSVGSGGCIRGASERLRHYNARVEIVAVEPSESPVLSGGNKGAHQIDGIGAGFVVPLWNQSIAARIETVSTVEAVAMALRLATEEGIFGGPSTGCNVVAALRVAERLPADSSVVTIMCDTGMKYLGKYTKTLAAQRA